MVLERFYAWIQRDDRDAQIELQRAKVLQLDVTKASLADFGVPPRSIGGIVTSPPYLCMSDYVLGQRLSYEWLFPGTLGADFAREIGARRRRSSPDAALESYFDSLRSFAKLAAEMIRPGGFLATVLGMPFRGNLKTSPSCKSSTDFLHSTDLGESGKAAGAINWHRNHGYARLKTEARRSACFRLAELPDSKTAGAKLMDENPLRLHAATRKRDLERCAFGSAKVWARPMPQPAEGTLNAAAPGPLDGGN